MATVAERGRRSVAVAPQYRIIARAAIALGTLAVGALIIPSSLATALSDANPQAAARIAPWDARVAAAAAAAASLEGKRGQLQSRALVRQVLARDVTNPSAIELRAADLAMSGRRDAAARLFQLSDRLSRRSLPTRLWLIQSAVDRGDVAGALANFDIALRTSTQAPPILFPVLAKASADPQLTAPLAKLLDRPSDWRLTYFEWVLANANDVHSLANVALRMRDRSLITQNGIDQRMIEQLVTAEDFGQALLVRQRFGPPSTTLVADPTFADVSARYPFGWGLVSDGSLVAERSLVQGGAVLAYRAISPHSGQVAAQLLALSSGFYAFTARTAATAVGPAPYWSLVCGRSRARLASLDQPSAGGRAATVQFVVPPGCPAQWLTLSLRPPGDSVTQSGAIASVSVTRL